MELLARGHRESARRGMANKYTESGMGLAFKSMIVTGALALEFLCAVPGYADDSRPPAASSQKTPIKRTVLRRTDVPHTDFEVVYALVEIPPNSVAGKHTHPGTVFGYLLGGDYTVLISGNADRKVKPGETWEVPRDVVHDEHTGNAGAKILAVFTVEKGFPLTSPAD